MRRLSSSEYGAKQPVGPLAAKRALSGQEYHSTSYLSGKRELTARSACGREVVKQPRKYSEARGLRVVNKASNGKEALSGQDGN